MSFESDMIVWLPVLRRYARALTGDSAWADDLVQDTVEQALNSSRSLHSGSNVRAWLLTILRHLFIDQLRKRREIPLDDENAVWRTMTTVAEVDGLFLRDVERALYRLPIDQREIMLLVGLEDLSYEEVAAVLKIPIGTVMSRLSRAREHMRGMLLTEDPSSKRPSLKIVRNSP